MLPSPIPAMSGVASAHSHHSFRGGDDNRVPGRCAGLFFFYQICRSVGDLDAVAVIFPLAPCMGKVRCRFPGREAAQIRCRSALQAPAIVLNPTDCLHSSIFSPQGKQEAHRPISFPK
ncbi:hypothetical protein BS78_05G132300 [Paspalum vaginatum]|nr:hypothetical protein BS78_05G132300 [Paspalum vaginatum]